MDKDLLKAIIMERKNKDIEDGYGIQKCWDAMVSILTLNEEETIVYLENCSKEELSYVREVFDDVAGQLQSRRFIACIKKLDKLYPELEMGIDVEFAEAAMN